MKKILLAITNFKKEKYLERAIRSCEAQIPNGIIINIGSSSSYAGFSDNSLYCLTKHAILGASRSLFEEFKKENIRVYCISPSGTKTNMGEKIQGQDYNTFLNPEEISNFIKYIIENSDSNMILNEVFLKRYYN